MSVIWMPKVTVYRCWGADSLGKVYTSMKTQVWIPSISVKSGAWWHILTIPVLDRWAQEGLWGLLMSQPSQMGEVQISQRPCLKGGG